MIEDVTVPATRCYEVEVSGWDSAQNFFVERCDLEWNQEGGKRVRLAQDLRQNAIVFVRLLQPRPSEQALPVAYEAEFLEDSGEGKRRFQLKAVVPRPREVPAWS